MLWYTYEALDGQAKEVTDMLLAESSKDAISQIRDKGLFPTKVREIGKKEVQENMELLSAWKANREQMVPIESIFKTKLKQSYVEYLSDLFGNKLIKWGKKLRGEK